jgi:hypothetical protein
VENNRAYYYDTSQPKSITRIIADFVKEDIPYDPVDAQVGSILVSYRVHFDGILQLSYCGLYPEYLISTFQWEEAVASSGDMLLQVLQRVEPYSKLYPQLHAQLQSSIASIHVLSASEARNQSLDGLPNASWNLSL